MSRFWRQFGWLLRRKTRESELQEEIAFHIETEREEREAAGRTAEQARSDALREFGNVTRHKEDMRSAWGWMLVDEFRRDLHYGLRNLRRNPGFAAMAVGTLAVGIGAATAIFSIVNGVLFEAFPYHDPGRLVLIFERLSMMRGKHGVSPPDFEFLRREAKSFAGMAAYSNVEYELSGAGESRRLVGARVSAELFSVLGVAPVIGRAITPADDLQNASVAVLSHRLWSTLGRDTSIVGETIRLDRRPYTVVGVMPEGFDFPARGPAVNGKPAELFVPMAFSKIEREGFGMRYNQTLIARLKPGVFIHQARRELETLKASLTRQYPAVLQSFMDGLSIPVIPLADETAGRSRNMLLVLLGAVALVLLIVCADVASLMLTRFGSRSREIAVRSSLGAGPARILRQLLAESLTLGILGAAFGWLFAYGAMRLLLAFGVATLPRAESIALNDRVLLFAVLLALLTPLLFGALPALRSAAESHAKTLKDTPRTATAGRGSSRLLGALAITQIALALVLSVGSGLLLRSFLQLIRVDTGFRPEKRVLLSVTLPSGDYAQRGQIRAFYDRALEAARAIPGVLAAGVGSDLPLSVRERRAFSAEPAQPIPESSRSIAVTFASSAYFDALGIPLQRGRLFTSADTQERPVVLVNRILAEMVWPGEDPVGRRIKWGIEASQAPWMTIVGVVGNVKQSALDEPMMAQVYVPLSLLEPGALSRTVNLIVRSERDSTSLIADLRRAVQQLDPSLPVSRAQPLEAVVAESLQPRRFSLTVLTLFATIALTLAAIGIYGVLASLVTQRTQEIAIRMALGAGAGNVMWMLGRRALVLVTAGIALGVAGSWAATRALAGMLYEVRPTDTLAFAGATVVLALLALVASLAPAWRAIRIDPQVALRSQ